MLQQFTNLTPKEMAKISPGVKESAKILYMNGCEQKEIAARLEVSENTVSKWKREGNWETVKKNLINSKNERLSDLYDELAEFSRMIKEREGYKVPSSKEADARRKLISDIKDLETKYNVAETITMAKDFVLFCKEIDFEFSKQALEYLDAFINAKIEQHKWQSQ